MLNISDMEKKCFKCEKEKPLSEFYKHKGMADGHLNKCKSCTRSDVKAHRERNVDHVRQYERGRNKLPHRAEARRKYSKTDAGKESKAKRNARYRDRHPERIKARTAVRGAIRDGRLIRPSACECCGEPCAPHAHHWSYKEDNWLDVEWLCVPCHIDIHNH